MSDTPGKLTLVLGASLNPQRYSHSAVRMLREYGHPVVAVGLREGRIDGVEVLRGQPGCEGVDTITLYMNPRNQEPYYDYILGLSPKRIIFNPGTENADLRKLAQESGIDTEYNCTLYMLSLGLY